MKYAFGDSELACERMGIVAATFEAPTRALLAALPPGDRRYVLDMGCGPGYTTALLVESFPHAFVTGIDGSEAMVGEARTRVPAAQFAVADVTEPVALPAHVVYARLLLGHVTDQHGALAVWTNALRPDGLVVVEEPVRYRSDVDAFTRYEAKVTAAVAARGGTLWASAALDDDPPNCARVIDRVVEHPVAVARAGAMFWRNAVAWGGDAELIEELQSIEAAGCDAVVMWELRQTVWLKRPA